MSTSIISTDLQRLASLNVAYYDAHISYKNGIEIRIFLQIGYSYHGLNNYTKHVLSNH